MTESTVNYVILSSRVKPKLLFSGIAVWSNFKNFETEGNLSRIFLDVIISKLAQPSRGTALYCVRNLFRITKRKLVASHC